MIRERDAKQAKEMMKEGNTLFVDVRQREFFDEARIPGAVSIDDETIDAFINDTPKDQRMVVYCYAGNFAPGGVNYLQKRGFTDVYTLWGGFEHWKAEFPEDVESTAN